MSHFQIKQINPLHHRNQILKFWDEYLPDTPHSRFEWMMEGNPAGSTQWFFAFDKKSGELAGMISLMPRQLISNGRIIRAGIMGDLAVGKRFRVFGPALPLVKFVLSSLSEYGFDFIYTIPNPDSRMLLDRAGFTVAGHFLHLVKPLQFSYYAQRNESHLLSLIPASVGRTAVRVLSRETYTSCSGVREANTSNIEIGSLFKKVSMAPQGVSAYRNMDYIKWRYFDNPYNKFRMLVCKNSRNNTLSGYLVFLVEGDRVHIYDIFSVDRKSTLSLIKKLTQVATQEKRIGIYIRLIDSNPILPILKKCLFVDTKDKAPVMIYSDRPISLDNWAFFSGDRNI